MTAIMLFQVIVIGVIIAQFALVIAALLRVNRQPLTGTQAVLWNLMVLTTPIIGALLVFVSFPSTRGQDG